MEHVSVRFSSDYKFIHTKMMQENKPLVTIITITFNLIRDGREKTFRQCLESVHEQTYENIEHIIIDGASRDGTINLIKEYADKGWIKYISEPDNGIYDAMNKGIDMANGKYVAFLNSDDYYHCKHGIESAVLSLESSSADFSFAPALILTEGGKEFKHHPQSKPSLANGFFRMPFCHQTMLTRRDVMITEGKFNCNYKSASDYDFVIRLMLKKYKGINSEKKYVTYRLGGLSDSERTVQISIKETAILLFENYNKHFPISISECQKIQKKAMLSGDVARKLSDISGLNVNRKAKMNIGLFFVILVSKINFLIFSPKKFFKKQLRRVLDGRLRQPVRKIYYSIRLKK